MSHPSSEWAVDIYNMHRHFGHKVRVNEMNPKQLAHLLLFRMHFIEEEFHETVEAAEVGDAEEIVDGIIDLIVVAIGTLELFNIDMDRAWSCVHAANMAKISGYNESRPNPLGLPDLTKPEGWVGPSHAGNHGTLPIVDYEEYRRLREAA